MGHKMRDVRPPFSQGRKRDRDHEKAIEKVLAKVAFLYFLFQIPVRGGNDAYIHRYRLTTANRLEAAFFEHLQDLHLEVLAHVADLIQKDGSPVGGLELADFIGRGTGERTFQVAEELTLQQVFRDGAAIDRDKGLILSIGLLVDGVGNQPFPGPGFSVD